jgi:ATP-dependent DNA helicase RecG
MENMDKKELDLLIQQGEGYNLEFKESLPNDLARTICGFANANGGKILIGVDDKGYIPTKLIF